MEGERRGWQWVWQLSATMRMRKRSNWIFHCEISPQLSQVWFLSAFSDIDNCQGETRDSTRHWVLSAIQNLTSQWRQTSHPGQNYLTRVNMSTNYVPSFLVWYLKPLTFQFQPVYRVFYIIKVPGGIQFCKDSSVQRPLLVQKNPPNQKRPVHLL